MTEISTAIVDGVTGVAGNMTTLLGDLAPIVIGVVGACVLLTKGIGVFKTLVGKV